MSTLQKRLKDLRAAKGWTQEELAKKVGIRQSFIGALESSGQKGSAYLPEIAHALGVDAYWLKTGIKTLVADDARINEVVSIMRGMSAEGKAITLYKAKEIAKDHQAPKERAA
jgi:transcriptional regulator with XRE-family HTH domain